MKFLAFTFCVVTVQALPPELPNYKNIRRATNRVAAVTNSVRAYKPPKPLTAAELPPRTVIPVKYWVRYGTTNTFADKTLNNVWTEYPPPPGPGETNAVKKTEK